MPLDRGPNRRPATMISALPRRRRPDPRAVALAMLSAFLTGKARPLPGRTPMPAPPRQPAGGVEFPNRGSARPVPAAAPPLVPFPPPPAAGGHARPTAMDAIRHFVETARRRDRGGA